MTTRYAQLPWNTCNHHSKFYKIVSPFFRSNAFLPFFSISLLSLYVIPEKPFWELISFFLREKRGSMTTRHVQLLWNTCNHHILTSMALFFGHVNVLLTISFILLELGLTPLRDNIVVTLHLSCLVIIFLLILLL